MAGTPLAAQPLDRREQQIQRTLERKQSALQTWNACFARGLDSIAPDADRDWHTAARVFRACANEERAYVLSARAYADARRPPPPPRRYGDPVTYTVDDHYVNHERGEWSAIRDEMENRIRIRLQIEPRCVWVTTNYFTRGGNACRVPDSEMGLFIFDFP